MRRWLAAPLLSAGFYVLGRGLALLAVEINAAGALLSPGGAVRLEAAAVALAFLAMRAAFVCAVGATAALLAARLFGAAAARGQRPRWNSGRPSARLRTSTIPPCPTRIRVGPACT